MSTDNILTEAIKRAIQKESGRVLYSPLLTSHQRANAGGLADRIAKNPPPSVPLTRRDGDQTVKYFMLGKDALSDTPDWELY